MKRSVLLGLFVTASVLASPSFAADLCDTNIIALQNAKTQVQGSELEAKTMTTLEKAKNFKAQNTEQATKECITETTQMLQEIEKVSKDGKNS